MSSDAQAKARSRRAERWAILRRFMVFRLPPLWRVGRNSCDRGRRLWPRVEMSRSFVLSKLRRILYIEQNRVEVGDHLAKNASFSREGSTAGSTAGALCAETER